MSELPALTKKKWKKNPVKTPKITNKNLPHLELLRKEGHQKSSWTDSSDSDLKFTFNLSSIVPGVSKGVNFERTYDACAAAEIMNSMLLSFLSEPQDLLSLHMSTGHKGRIPGLVWILEILMPGAARYRLLPPLQGICVTRKSVSLLKLPTHRTNII